MTYSHIKTINAWKPGVAGTGPGNAQFMQMALVCSQCNSQIRDPKDKFCHECGHEFVVIPEYLYQPAIVELINASKTELIQKTDAYINPPKKEDE